MISLETKVGLLVGLGFIVVFSMVMPTVGVVEPEMGQPDAPISTPGSFSEYAVLFIQLWGLLRWLIDDVGGTRR